LPFFDGSFYELRSTPLNWEDANNAANVVTLGACTGAHLATVTSVSEQLVVDDLMEFSDTNAWLGGFQPPNELSLADGWEWVTGEAFAYTNWGAGEPNDTPFGTPIVGSEQHLEPLLGTGVWNDAPGIEPKYYIVEYEGCPPLMALAGPDQHVSVGDLVTLDGSDSFDVEDPSSQLTYQWEQIQGPEFPQDAVTLIVPNPSTTPYPEKARASFQAIPNIADPFFSPVRTYAFRLTVTDTDGNSESDDIVITALEDAGNAIFVSANLGDDLGDGSMEFPVKTLEQAFDLARVNRPRSDIYLHAKGYLVGSTPTVRNNMSLYGGFDAAVSPDGTVQGWTRTASTPTLLVGAATALEVLNIFSPTTIDGLTIRSADGAGGTSIGESSIGISVSNADQNLRITNNEIEAGLGRPGISGVAGLPGAPGGAGFNSLNLVTPPAANIGFPGNGGSGPCHRDGGSGGLGGFALALPTPGFGGGTGGGGTPGGFGAGFDAVIPPAFEGQNGGNGSAGNDGNRGGGGGGQAGGHSYGIFLSDATPSIMGNTFTTEGGGSGGSGGRGGSGGAGGSGGISSFPDLGGFYSGHGGNGGRGGHGAGGGGGGGGLGGDSCGIYVGQGSGPTMIGNVYGVVVPPGFLTDSFIGLSGSGGFGGMGGSGPVSQLRGING
jgi:K319L-like, PKD domain